MTNPNPSPVEMTVNSISLAGSCGVQISSDGCSGVALGPKGSVGPTPPPATCAIGLVYKPTATGLCSQSLQVNSDAKNSPSTISMSGTGTLTAPVLSPTSLSFGATTVGTTRELFVTVTNNNANIPGGTINFTAPPSTSNPVFTVDSGPATTCGSTLAGGGTSCMIGVIFAPTASGTTSGTLNLTDNGGTGAQKVTLFGTGN
jgi:hypothetical protein